MMRRRWFILLLVLAAGLLTAPVAAQSQDDRLYDIVAMILQRQYYDADYREHELPALIEKYRDEAARAVDERAERAVVESMLAEIPASHLQLLTRSTYTRMIHELQGRDAPTIGMELMQIDGGYYATSVLAGGPAERAGVLNGDRIRSIDGDEPAASPRLDGRSDDASLPDPPVHGLRVDNGDEVRLLIERRPGDVMGLTVPAEDYSAWRAARNSACVIERDGVKIAYVHFWFIHMRGPDRLLRELIAEPFADADALVLDLRGRGGSAGMVLSILSIFRGRAAVWDKPLVALTDANTRSAKEVIAWELRDKDAATLVGERTAGAVLPAGFVPANDEWVLMYPVSRLGKYTTHIEGVGVPPHVEVEAAGPYAAGKDPIAERGVEVAIERVMNARGEGIGARGIRH